MTPNEAFLTNLGLFMLLVPAAFVIVGLGMLWRDTHAAIKLRREKRRREGSPMTKDETISDTEQEQR